jgi:hypothetical protein
MDAPKCLMAGCSIRFAGSHATMRIMTSNAPYGEDGPLRGEYFTDAWYKPAHWLPGALGRSISVVATDDTAVFALSDGVYPQGWSFTLGVRLRPETEVRHRSQGDPGDSGGVCEGLRFGVVMPDGHELFIEDLGSSQWPAELPYDPDARRCLYPYGGDEGRLDADWRFWLNPLPTCGQLTLVCGWPGRDIPETRAHVDSAEFVAALEQARELWPMNEWRRRAD